MQRLQAEDMTVTVDAWLASWEDKQALREGFLLRLTQEAQQWNHTRDIQDDNA